MQSRFKYQTMKASHCKFHVSHNVLPKQTEQRYEILFSLFSHSDIYCKLVDGIWEITLSFPSDLKYYVDQQLLQGLNWWSPTAKIESIPLEHKKTSYGQIMLHDTWTLQSWLDFVRVQKPTKIIVLHFDAHTDLMDPKIGIVNSELCHLTTATRFNPFYPGEVSRAINLGSIDQGCYIVPFIHVFNNVEIIHVTPYKTPPQSYQAEPIFKQDTSLWPQTPRCSVKLTHSLFPTQYKNTSSMYHVVNEFSDIFDLLKHDNSPILLHIDMDFICNRFNRQSDWYLSENLKEDSIDSVNQKIYELGTFITESSIRKRIINVDVALVPGFFPSEYWKTATIYLESFLRQLVFRPTNIAG